MMETLSEKNQVRGMSRRVAKVENRLVGATLNVDGWKEGQTGSPLDELTKLLTKCRRWCLSILPSSLLLSLTRSLSGEPFSFHNSSSEP